VSNPITDRLTALATCLCAAIEDPDSGVPGVCFCGIIPGNAIPVEYTGDCNDKCGAAWVRLTTAYPANAVGVLNTQATACDSGMGIDVEIGILRCISVGDAQGNPPEPAELLAGAELAMDDLMLMWRAVLCCDAFDSRDVILGQYQPVGPEGGLVGGAFTLSMGV
jgi:hypothetical protein